MAKKDPQQTSSRNGTRKKRVTISDLARELGLSDRAVSQALSPRESNVKLRPETVERVQDLAEKLGYRPDSRARSMRYGKFFNIGYFEAKKTARALPLPGAEAGVFEAASDNGYRVVLIRLSSDMSKDPTAIPNVFRESLLDVLILSHAGNLPPDIAQQINASGYPVVYLNEKMDYNAVYADDVLGTKILTEHLIQSGRKRIAFVAYPTEDIKNKQHEEHYSEADRKEGYLQAITEASLKPMVVNLGSSVKEVEEKLPDWFEANYSKIDAIMCTNDFNAMRTQRLLYKYRDLFPHHIAITGYDDMAEFLSAIPLTTMRVPFYEMGQRAVKIALEMVDSKKDKVPSEIVQSELIVRESTTASA